MRAEAESHAEEDRKRLAEIEARNQCDTRVYQVEKLLRENREKLPEADAKLVEEALEQCRRALADGSIDRIKSATEALERTTHKVAEVLYRTGAAAAQGGPGGPTSPGTGTPGSGGRSEEHTSELQSRLHLVCRLLLEKKKKRHCTTHST